MGQASQNLLNYPIHKPTFLNIEIYKNNLFKITEENYDIEKLSRVGNSYKVISQIFDEISNTDYPIPPINKLHINSQDTSLKDHPGTVHLCDCYQSYK